MSKGLREHAMMTTNSLERRSRQCLVLKQVHECPLTLARSAGERWRASVLLMGALFVDVGQHWLASVSKMRRMRGDR